MKRTMVYLLVTVIMLTSIIAIPTGVFAEAEASTVVESTVPANGGTISSTDGNYVEIHFRYEMNTATLSPDTITIQDAAGNGVTYTEYVAEALAYKIPLKVFTPNTTYTVTVAGTIEDENGLATDEAYSFSFTTGIVGEVIDGKLVKNVAYGKSVYCNKPYPGYEDKAGRLTDGKIEKDGMTTVSAEGAKYFEIDLGGYYDVKAIITYTRIGCDYNDSLGVTAYASLVQLPEGSITSAASLGDCYSAEDGSKTITLEKPVKARYMYFYKTRQGMLRFSEIEVKALVPMTGSVEYTMPSDGESGVVNSSACYKNIEIGFCETMNQDTLIPANITVAEVGEEAETPVAYTEFTATEDKYRIPTKILSSNKTYKVTVSDNVQNASNEAVETYTFTFTTGDILDIPEGFVLENVALGKDVSYVGTLFDPKEPMSNINDGDTKTNAYLTTAKPQCVIIDLGEQYKINKVVLTPRLSQYSYTDTVRAVVYGLNDVLTAEQLATDAVLKEKGIYLGSGYCGGEGAAVTLNTAEADAFRYLYVYKNTELGGYFIYSEVEAYGLVPEENYIKHVYPAEHAENVSNLSESDRDIVITFKEAMSRNTLTPENIVIKTGGNIVEYTQYTATDNTYSVPLAILEDNTKYTVTVGAAVKNASEVMMGKTYSFEFTTGKLYRTFEGKTLTNVALGKTAYCPQPFEDFASKLPSLTDGNYDGNFMAASHQVEEKWFAVDLGGIYDISYVKLTARASNKGYAPNDTKDTAVYFANELYENGADIKSRGTNIGNGTISAAGGHVVIEAPSGTKGRYIYIYRENLKNIMAYSEIEVFTALSDAYTFSGLKISGGFENGGTITAETAFSGIEAEKTPQMYIALYDQSGSAVKLADVYQASQQTTGNNTIKSIAVIQLPDDVTGHSVKVIILENSQTPVMSAYVAE